MIAEIEETRLQTKVDEKARRVRSVPSRGDNCKLSEPRKERLGGRDGGICVRKNQALEYFYARIIFFFFFWFYSLFLFF